MIIPAVKRGQGRQLADYLLKEKKNDRAELIEMRGFADINNLENGLLGMELEAAQTKGTKPFYHAAMRLDEGERLNREQWLHCVDALGHRLGLDEQARAVVMHEQQGEQHIHIVWSLVDRERGKMIELPFDAERRVEVARQLEREYGLRELSPAHQRTKERLSRADYEQARREERPVEEVRDTRAAIREAWKHSDNGAALVHALEEAGLTLARGDSERAPLGVVDERGQFHALTRATGARAKEVRERLADIELKEIPTAKETRQQQERAQQERELSAREQEATPETRQPPQECRRETTRAEEPPAPSLRQRAAIFVSKAVQGIKDYLAEQHPPKSPQERQSEQEQAEQERRREQRGRIREAWRESQDGRGFGQELEERGLYLARDERDDFFAVDEQGFAHRIDRGTTGAGAGVVQARLNNVSPPTVEQAREVQRDLMLLRGEKPQLLETIEALRDVAVSVGKSVDGDSLARFFKDEKGTLSRQEAREQREQEQAQRARQPESLKATTPGTPDKETGRVADAFVKTAFSGLEGVADFFVGPSPPKTPQELKAERQEGAERAQARKEEKQKAEQHERRPMTLEESLALARQRAAEKQAGRNMDDDARRKLEEERQRNWWDRGRERER